MLVEDNPVNQELALEILQGAGLRVDIAENGVEAIEKIGQTAYDGVLMDCQMPVMDGFEATRQIRQDKRFDALPILAMTANAMAGDKEKCLECGMNAHIGKPIDISQLFETLARWIKPKTRPAVAAPVAVPSEDTALPNIEGLELINALNRVGGNAALLRKLILRFKETQAEVLERINAAIETNDNTTATREAHTLKGLAGNIGAVRMFEAAANLEGILNRGQTDSLSDALKETEIELNGLIERISQAMPTTVEAPRQTAAVDNETLAAQIRKLAAFLADDDSQAAEMIDGVVDMLRSAGQASAAKMVAASIANFDYEDALSKLKEIAVSLGMEP